MANLLFENISLSDELLRAIEDMNYTETTEIQAGAIPQIMKGRDVIGRSSTGTGKTAAFGIPAVEMVDSDEKYPQVLVLSPTRELAMQTAGEMRKYAKYKEGVSFAVVYGGQSIDLQFRQLKKANIVIGTPGRIMDHMRHHTLQLDSIRLVVLDEADEMLDMGFVEDIQTILKETPENRQTVLFSATMPPPILKITGEFQKDPVIIAVDKGQRTLDTITQYYYQVPQTHKADALNLLLQQYAPVRSIVFCNTKSMVEELVTYLNEHGFKSAGLHGDMKQMMRTRVMEEFKSGRVPILVATDVAARGIDVEDVDGVFNYDIPQEMEYYIHRIGRTGRAGKTGVSYTLACNRTQVRRVKEIQEYVKMPIEEQPLPSADDIIARRREKLAEKVEKAIDSGVGEHWQEILKKLTGKGYNTEQIALALFSIAAGKEKKLVPAVRAVQIEQPRSGPSVYVRLDIGRKDNVVPGNIVGAILDATGLTNKAIGKIDIRMEETFVEMGAENAKLALEVMQGGRIKGKAVTPSIVTSKPFVKASAGGRDFRKPRRGYASKAAGRKKENNRYR